MTGVLVVTQGPLAGQRLEVNGELVIGREGVSVTIEDSELSRRHAAVRPVDGGFEIEDLGSLNGTFVNGERISGSRRLSGGDSIKVGTSVLELEGPRVAATVASPVPAAAVAASAGAVTVPTPGRAPSAPFGAYAAPAANKRASWIGTRQLGPLFATWAIVGATAVTLVIYFAEH